MAAADERAAAVSRCDAPKQVGNGGSAYAIVASVHSKGWRAASLTVVWIGCITGAPASAATLVPTERREPWLRRNLTRRTGHASCVPHARTLQAISNP